MTEMASSSKFAPAIFVEFTGTPSKNVSGFHDRATEYTLLASWKASIGDKGDGKARGIEEKAVDLRAISTA